MTPYSISPAPQLPRRRAWPLALTAAAMLALAAPLAAQSPGDRVHLRDDYRAGERYATVTRGGITEALYVGAAALAAVRAGEPFPEGTVITMDDFGDGALHRVLVMEKRAEWADDSTAGGWFFAEFAPDGTPNMTEDYGRCQACHASQAANDFVFTRPRMLD